MSLLFKMIYTALLFGITAVAVRELWFVWFDTRVYIGRFDVVNELGKDDAASEAFAKRIVAQQTIVAQQLTDYKTRRDALSDTTYRIDGITPLQLPLEVLGGIDITVQEINVRQVLTAVRRGFLAPNEISGSVTQQGNSVIGLVDWPNAPPIAGDGAAVAKFLTPNRESVQAVAAHIACSITWARASNAQDSVLSRPYWWWTRSTGNPTATQLPLAVISPRTQFCDFVAALGDLYSFEDKASSSEGLDEIQTGIVRKHVAVLRSHYDDAAVLPDIYRLRADLLDLIPEARRMPAELVDAQEDRLRYAMLSPTLQALPEETRRIAALALARPAIIMENGKPRDVPANWASLLATRTAEVAAVSAATGMVVHRKNQHLGTGFIVAPKLMITTGYVLDTILQDKADDPTGWAAKLCLGSTTESCNDGLAIDRVVYDGRSQGSNIVLLELPTHDPALSPPALISDIAIEPNSVIGRYAYVIGYPARDTRMPPEFIERLLGKTSGSKRIMPGRILAFGKQSIFTSDISTTGGTGGGPFVDLMTGKVLGVSYAGRWNGERGKFADSESIPAAALEIIRKRLAGEPELER